MEQRISPYNYILCSSFARVVETLVQQWCVVPGQYRICYIANAADFDKTWDDFPWWVLEDIEALKNLWYTLDFVDLRKENMISLDEKLSSANAVFVWWGNTFRLLQCMIESWFRDSIKKHMGNGLVYISTSAGSCVCSEDITYVQFADNPALAANTDYRGLWFLPLAIKPHFNKVTLSENTVRAFEFVYTREHNPIICLKDSQAIVWTLDWLWKIVA